MKFLICLLLLFVIGFGIRIHIKSDSLPPIYTEGDVVQVKLTGDIGMVTDHLWGDEYLVTLKNYSTKMFHDFELTPASAGGMIAQSSGGTVPAAEQTPNQIFNNEKVWNPQTQRYE